ncbi:MAG: Rossmann-like domain-containing protein [Gammaproteobacteria bacterium]
MSFYVMNVANELIAIVEQVSRQIEIPPIRHLHIPPAVDNPDIDAEFGLIGLEDGSVGFFYAWLGDTLRRLRTELDRDGIVGESALALAKRYGSEDEMERSVGLGAINAISQHVFRRADVDLTVTANSMGGLQLSRADHVGMVGLFPSLARRLSRDGVRLTVVERKTKALTSQERYTVTLDPAQLQACNKVLCTASTLLNNTLDEILEHCRSAERIALIGPTAGCLPDPLFKRGVDIVGGSRVASLAPLLEKLGSGLGWGDLVEKYTIAGEHYPGVEALLASIAPAPVS